MRTLMVRAALTAALALASTTAAYAQATGSVAGTVLNAETQQPLAGAQVRVPGTQLLAVSDREGRFLLANVPAGQATVRVQLIGHASVVQLLSVTPGVTATAQFQLQPQAVALEELVVTGYGTQQREDITGAVARIAADEFVQVTPRDAGSLIAGKVAGLAVTQSSGNPRAETEITLRGVTTVQGPRSPLVLVDGVPGSLETVAPQDIASVDVLKDGSAAAIYGSRASNGVILITTKRYEGGAATIRLDSWVSQQTLYRTPQFLDAADYRRLNGEWRAAGLTDTFPDFGYATDWQDQVLHNPVSYNTNLTITGGAPNTNYTAALTYENGQGIFNRSDNRELTGRVNLGHSMFDGKLHADLNLLTRVENAFTGPNYDYAWRQTLIRNPTDQVKDSTGAWQERGTYFYVNPVGLIEEENGEYEQRNLRLHGTLTFRPTDNLQLSFMSGTERASELVGSATSFRHVNTTLNNQSGTAGRSDTSTVDRVLEVTGTYTARPGRHTVTLLGGYGYQDRVEEWFGASSWNFPTDLFEYNRLQSGGALATGQANMSSGKESFKTIGFFSRLNWDFDNRYLLMASIRYEGDSRFGADHKWGAFPAVSAGWRISEESFLSGLSFLDDLKLKAGYGVTGIAPNNPYLSLTSYTYGARMLYNGTWVQGVSPSRNPNPDLRWERKQEVNVGLDVSLFNYRLSGTLDVYQRDTKDMLYNYSVPVPPYLNTTMRANVGHMKNNGVEASLTYDVVRGAGVRWTTNANWSTNSNKLVTLSNEAYQAADCFTPAGHTGEPIQQSTHRVCVGGPIGNFYGWESVDIDDNGEWIVLDSTGVQIPIDDATESDRRILGNGIPKHYLAWNNTLRFKGLDLSANMRGAFGFQILNFQRMYYENPTILEYNMLETAFDPVYGKRTLNYDLAYVSYYLEDGDYWKVDNVTLGYTFGAGAVPFLKNVVSSARVYVSGRNLHTFTGYKGLDPEVTTSMNVGPGNDARDKYPTTRTFTAGLSLTF